MSDRIAGVRRERLHLAILTVLCVLILFADAAVKELHGTAVFYASLVRELVVAGDPMLIYADDRAYLLKPPLVVWLSAIFCKVFGLTNFGVTFISRLAGVGVILLIYALLRRWWSHPIAWLSAFAVLTNSTFVQFTATLRMDSLLMLGLMLSLTGWAYRGAPWSAAAMFGGVTIAVLSKGPLGFAAIPLIVCHALLLRTRPVVGRNWWWALLLLPLVGWYAVLVALHGLKPFSELGADALRVTATPQLDVWASIVQEYMLKPARRYWPWLPFMLVGGVIVCRRVFDSRQVREMRMHYVWVLMWFAVVVVTAALKPDHDIRYFYPALPVLGLFTGIAIAVLTRDRLPTWAPIAVLLAVAIATGQRHPDTRATISAIRKELGATEQPLAIGGYPVPPHQPRRQNTHRDWVHFYTGSTPRVLSWEQARTELPDFGGGVFMTRSRGHPQRLAEFGLKARHVTQEMIFAVPQ